MSAARPRTRCVRTYLPSAEIVSESLTSKWPSTLTRLPLDSGKQVSLVAVDRRAGAALRVTARVLEHQAAVVDRCRCPRSPATPSPSMSTAPVRRAVRVAHVVVRDVVGHVRVVVEIVLVLHQRDGTSARAGSRAPGRRRACPCCTRTRSRRCRGRPRNSWPPVSATNWLSPSPSDDWPVWPRTVKPSKSFFRRKFTTPDTPSAP